MWKQRQIKTSIYDRNICTGVLLGIFFSNLNYGGHVNLGVVSICDIMVSAHMWHYITYLALQSNLYNTSNKRYCS